MGVPVAPAPSVCCRVCAQHHPEQGTWAGQGEVRLPGCHCKGPLREPRKSRTLCQQHGRRAVSFGGSGFLPLALSIHGAAAKPGVRGEGLSGAAQRGSPAGQAWTLLFM